MGAAPAMLTALSVFAGIGGFDLACQRAGMEARAAVEIDPACRAVLARHFPTTLLYEDVQRVHDKCPHGCKDCLPYGRVDLVCGGFPCQDLSLAGRRAGLAGLRSGLFFELARVIAETAPRWVVLENVPGLLSSNSGRDMAAVVGTLGDLGYGWAYRVLDAQFFGLAQRRRRVFVVGCLGDRAAPVQVLLEPESRGGDSPQGQQAGQGVAATLTSGVSGPGVSAPGRRQEDDDVNLVVAALTANGVGTCGADDNQAQAGHLVAPALTAGMGTNGANPGDAGKDQLALSAIAAGAGVRKLTPVECERLQGFPDGWTAGQSDSARYRQMGNAVAVPVVEWIMRRIAAVDAKAVAA